MTFSKIFMPTLFGLLLPIPTVAAALSQAELAALPPYCAARLNEGTEAFKSWRSTMGGDFIHIHHYYNGLNLLNRTRSMFSTKESGMLEAAVREFDYVLTHASPGFYLRPEILMNRGIALSMMKRNGEAVSNLLKAIELDAKQPRAYMALADLYDKLKSRSKALETVTEGLRHNPGTKSLQRRYTELGGKLPYPAAIEQAQAEAQVAKPDDVVATPPTSSSEPSAATPATETPDAGPIAPPKIGSQKNPYCRFCPD
jgi:tetratricopeptide (TPR) repeat protein